MTIRQPIVAGQFYPASASACRHQADECFRHARIPSDLSGTVVAGLVPHAGWICSGAVAATTLATIAAQRTPDTFILFGAVHALGPTRAAVYSTGAWETPLGQVQVHEELARRIIRAGGNLCEDNPAPHDREHSLEVQMPLIRQQFPEATVVPIMVPPDDHAPQVGQVVATALAENDIDAVCIGSTDLTHYGPGYGITPAGIGKEGLDWAKNVNDRNLLDMIGSLNADDIVSHTRRNHNACGGGAIAATVAAAKVLGATDARLLVHTTSAEVLAGHHGRRDNDAVGYASMVFLA